MHQTNLIGEERIAEERNVNFIVSHVQEEGLFGIDSTFHEANSLFSVSEFE